MDSSATADESSLGSNGNNTSEHAAALAAFAVNESRDVVSFYDVEAQILALYDQLNDLKLEIALQEAGNELPSTGTVSLDGDPHTQIKAAEKDCLEARAAYLLRNSIIENVLVADPILKAIHSGINATPAEMSLHPLIDRRDVLSIAHTNVSTELDSISKSTTSAEAKNMRAQREHRETATTLLNLANHTKNQRNGAIHGSGSSKQLERLQADTKIAHTRWRIMKSVVAAIVVGSGVDWAANDGLRDLVLDEEDEED